MKMEMTQCSAPFLPRFLHSYLSREVPLLFLTQELDLFIFLGCEHFSFLYPALASLSITLMLIPYFSHIAELVFRLCQTPTLDRAKQSVFSVLPQHDWRKSQINGR